MSSDQRRAAIVEAAVRLFAQYGFRGTTTKQIAAAVGVSEPVLYMHFETKRELYSAIIESLAQGGPGSAVAQPPCLMTKGLDDDTFFHSLAEKMLTWYTGDETRIRILLFSALEGHDLAEVFHKKHIVPFVDALTQYIEGRIRQGAFQETDPRVAARAFCGMISQYGQGLTVFHTREDADQQKKTLAGMVKIFLNGMKKPKGKGK